MEIKETRIIVTTHSAKKADKFRQLKEKQGFKYEGMSVARPEEYLPTYVIELSKTEQFK